MAVLRIFKDADVVAIFDQGEGGDYRDINAGKNAPAKNPVANLGKVHFHSSFGVFELAADAYIVTVEHEALPTASTVLHTILNYTLTRVGDHRRKRIPLVAHGQGRTPHYMIAYNDHRMPNGTVVQLEGSGYDQRERIMSHYATDIEIGLSEYAISSSSALSAVTRTYAVLVFKEPVPDPAKPLLGFDGTELILSHGVIRSSGKYLRKAKAEESSFDFNLGPTVDWSGGASRVVSGGISYTEPGYTGSFAGPPFVAVGWGE